MTFALTKIRPPRARAGFVARARLDATLSEGIASSRLVLLCAPAGFGKTALLARQVELLGSEVALAWISADEDDDLSRFGECLVAALEPFDLPWRTSPEALLATLDGARGARGAFAAGLINALLAAGERRGVIVLDDAHRIAEPAIFEFLDYLVERLPPNWVLVLSSREEPPLALARLRARGEAVELRYEALRFNEAEVRQLLERGPAAAASAAEAAELMQRTDGWPAGLALMIGHLSGQASPQRRASASGPHALRRQVFDYLATEVLAAMPRELREFLLRCSVLHELSPARCAAVSGDAAAARWLEQVQRSPLVSVLDEQEPVLRLHDLLRDCLDDLLRREMPDEIAALLQRAAAGETDPVRRIGYLLQAGVFADAEGALAAAGQKLIASGHTAAVLRLIDQFPPAWREQSARLTHWRGLCAWAHWDLLAACSALDRAATLYDQLGQPAGAQRARTMVAIGLTAGGQLERAAALLARVQAAPMDRHAEATAWQAQSWLLIATSRLSEVAESHAKMVDLLEADQRDGGIDAMLWFQSVPPTLMIGLPGVRPHLVRWVQGALARTPVEPPTQLRVLAQLQQAGLDLWEGRHEAAAEALQAAASDCRWLNEPPSVIGNLHRFAALTHAVRGEREAALAAADGMLHNLVTDERTSGRTKVWLNHMLYFKLRVAATLGDADVQREVVTRLSAAADAEETALFVRERACLPARLAELYERWADAAAGYEAALGDEAAIDLYGQAAELRMRLAHARLKLQQPAAAAAALAPVFEHVRASGEVGGVLLAGAAVLRALADARWSEALGADEQRALRDWAGLIGRAARVSLMAAVASTAVAAPAAPVASPASPAPSSNTGAALAGAASLSAREREVLRCIAAGDSNKVIARTFDLSPNTVKRHVSNILDKLALSSRGQAAAWYRGQG
jgi:LuxR family maltose regulon positive regulatory protein